MKKLLPSGFVVSIERSSGFKLSDGQAKPLTTFCPPAGMITRVLGKKCHPPPWTVWRYCIHWMYCTILVCGLSSIGRAIGMLNNRLPNDLSTGISSLISNLLDYRECVPYDNRVLKAFPTIDVFAHDRAVVPMPNYPRSYGALALNGGSRTVSGEGRKTNGTRNIAIQLSMPYGITQKLIWTNRHTVLFHCMLMPHLQRVHTRWPPDGLKIRHKWIIYIEIAPNLQANLPRLGMAILCQQTAKFAHTWENPWLRLNILVQTAHNSLVIASQGPTGDCIHNFTLWTDRIIRTIMKVLSIHRNSLEITPKTRRPPQVDGDVVCSW